ncbi:benzodiazapine receptor [Pedobacter sp. CG_S7]|uniref:TspO/MBR family protein n=1 Tax=Pedobacter sp. CG_S7 TaxID=3143930 RepID=UPI0033908A3E
MIAEKRSFQFIPLIINISIPLAFGVIGGLLTSNSVKTWYPTLNKPSFNPPNWIFGPVWTILYILIGIAAYLVWQKRDQVAHFPRIIAVYLIQLVLNLFWSFLFFYAHKIGASLFEISALLIVILINGRMFYKIDKTAGLLFIPYALWVSFATLLTYSIYSLN